MNNVFEAAHDDASTHLSDGRHLSLRLWLQLFTCTAAIERHVREKLRDRFDITLPRFELMAQLDREPKGLRMTELSHRLMVTGGNVTGLTDQLVAENLVVRRSIAGDRRAYNIRLTPKGKRQFQAMAAEHERWIDDLLADVPLEMRENLHESIAELKSAVVARLAAEAVSTHAEKR
jgi:DNA-binding MarR family transcriptional regulator